IIPELFGWTDDPAEIRRLADMKEAIFREQIREQGIEPLPGVVTLLQTLQSHGIPPAIGTSTPAANLECILEITGLAPYFAARVCSEDVTRGKPDPEVFLQAARRLGADPTRCVVFEDAPVGITAAKAAGMHCVAVATTRAPEQLRQADLVLPDLTAFPLKAVKDPFSCFTAEVSG
ncbi:MAG: HAD family hydrolase, partial [Lentisphaerae bacterium]